MPKYAVEIEETTIKTYEVEADSVVEAANKAEDRYSDGDLGDDPNWQIRGGYEIGEIHHDEPSPLFKQSDRR